MFFTVSVMKNVRLVNFSVHLMNSRENVAFIKFHSLFSQSLISLKDLILFLLLTKHNIKDFNQGPS